MRERHSAALSVGIRPLRALFEETSTNGLITWSCRLCQFFIQDTPAMNGWGCSVDVLYILVKHLRGHTQR